MEKRTLGKTGIEATVLGYGAMEIRLGEADGVSDADAGRILNAVLDGGINFVDTAPDYGLSEERIGKSISGRRDEYFLASKCGCNIPRDAGPDAPGHLWTRDQLMHNIELSLQRMKTDVIDIWQLHNPSVAEVEAGELVAAMEEVKQQGKVRHVSISSTIPSIREYITQGWFESYQIPYSALHRGEENSITAAAQSGAGTIIRGGVAQGEPGEGRGGEELWAPWTKAGLDDLLDGGESRSAFLLRFTITHPHMHTTIVGTKNPSHLGENLKAVEAGPLSAEVYKEAKERLERVGIKPA
jgi:aryl-alcohol dehydrogenase-like predicted oxidoreductase